MAVNDPECTFGFLDEVISKYAPSLIARQIAYKINNKSLKAHQFFAPLSAVGTNLVLAAKLKPDVESSWQLVAKLPPIVRQSYCSDTQVYWVAARRINSNLLVVVNDANDTEMLRQQFTPNSCPEWPASGASK